ncbi:MAG: right-handed parallel beta-helix repeat-containing protein [Clostridia bacterium]|nr:right-handed parallel beta-helix repeat-containing protein [Clostridia bacterium]
MQTDTFLLTDYDVKPNCSELQTEAVQKVLDMCSRNGGTVVIPAGTYRVSSLYLHSRTTLKLLSGACLVGSDECSDYEVFAVPEGVSMHCDMEMIPEYYKNKPWDTYRRAMITAYGEEDISIIGEPGSVIDGSNCYDPEGEENYRGPHAIFLSGCRHVLLEGYTVRHSGNFLHEANTCEDLTMRHVLCVGGSDGIHLHCSKRCLIEDCVFQTGDDCIAGINVEDLTVRHCVLNTSCNLFRLGGVHVLIEDVFAYGPGIYPHRMTVVRGKNDELPRECGRHNTIFALTYFASSQYPFKGSDITFRHCIFQNFDAFLDYRAFENNLQSGTCLKELILDHVLLENVRFASEPKGHPSCPTVIRFKHVFTAFADGDRARPLIRPGDFITQIEETEN